MALYIKLMNNFVLNCMNTYINARLHKQTAYVAQNDLYVPISFHTYIYTHLYVHLRMYNYMWRLCMYACMYWCTYGSILPTYRPMYECIYACHNLNSGHKLSWLIWKLLIIINSCSFFAMHIGLSFQLISTCRWNPMFQIMDDAGGLKNKSNPFALKMELYLRNGSGPFALKLEVARGFEKWILWMCSAGFKKEETHLLWK